MDFLYTTPPILVTWQAPRADKVTKIVLKVARDDFGHTSKKSYWLHLPFLFTIFFTIRGVGTILSDATKRNIKTNWLNSTPEKFHRVKFWNIQTFRPWRTWVILTYLKICLCCYMRCRAWHQKVPSWKMGKSQGSSYTTKHKGREFLLKCGFGEVIHSNQHCLNTNHWKESGEKATQPRKILNGGFPTSHKEDDFFQYRASSFFSLILFVHCHCAKNS